MMNFRPKMKRIEGFLEMGEYTVVARECVGLIEHALRHLFSQALTQLDEEDRLRVQDAEQNIGKGVKGIEHFTMGQLVGVLRTSRFLDAWARASGRNLSSLQMINLDQLTQLRNAFIHEGREASRAEAELLVKCLHVILESFGLARFEEETGGAVPSGREPGSTVLQQLEAPLFNERYEITEILGQGGFATTYLAVDIETQQQCAIKCLSFQKVKEWKTWELFERETRILKHLCHPQIPKYLDFFTIETERDIKIYLVQQYVEGHSLAQLVREGKHFTEREVIKMALGISRILDYLQSLSPPIIHRDIKPGNILLDPYNRAFLIDFGAVRDTIQTDILSYQGIPTIVGTYGYMPLEQAEGRAVPASDIYALGMTLIHVLAHKEPSQMEKHGLRVDFRPHVNISPGFAAILDRMIAPDWQNRYQSAAELRRDLNRLLAGKRPVKVSAVTSFRRAMLVAGILLFFIVTGIGVGGYFFYSDSPTPPLPKTITPTVSPPKPPTPQSRNIVYPKNGKISVDIYRDFRFVSKGWPLGLSVGQTSAGGVDTLPYEKLIREPEYRSEQVLYGYLPLGNGDDRQISFAIDETDRPNWVAYVDKNNNEDLTDDGPPHPNEGTGKMGARVTVQIEIVTLSEERIIQPYRLWMWFIESQGNPRFYTQCHYAGKISINAEVYTAIAYEQFHHDGLFRESGLWVDLNRDKKLDEETEHFQDGEMIQLDNKQYQVELQYP